MVCGYVKALVPPLQVDFISVAGDHSHVGGCTNPSNKDKIHEDLSLTPFRWMVKECLLVTDILFDVECLEEHGIDLETLTKEVITIRGEDTLTRLGFDIKALSERSKNKLSTITASVVSSSAILTSEALSARTARFHSALLYVRENWHDFREHYPALIEDALSIYAPHLSNVIGHAKHRWHDFREHHHLFSQKTHAHVHTTFSHLRGRLHNFKERHLILPEISLPTSDSSGHNIKNALIHIHDLKEHSLMLPENMITALVTVPVPVELEIHVGQAGSLAELRFWLIMEMIPTRCKFQQQDGTWVTKTR